MIQKPNVVVKSRLTEAAMDCKVYRYRRDEAETRRAEAARRVEIALLEYREAIDLTPLRTKAVLVQRGRR